MSSIAALLGADGVADDGTGRELASLSEVLTPDGALELAAAAELERTEAVEAALSAARARDRARLEARWAQAEQTAAQIEVAAKTLKTASERTAALAYAAEFRKVQRAACAADGLTLQRKRARETSSRALTPRRPMPRAFGEHEWIWGSREAAATVTDEDAQAQQHLLSLVLPQSRLQAPVRGQRRVFSIASNVSDMRLEQWMLIHTPALFTTNVVATANFGVAINALAVVNRIGGASFNPRCFAAVKVRVHGATHLIFSEGTVVCTGATSADAARIACIDTARLLLRAGIQAQFLRFEVRNVVSTTNTGFDVDLATIARTYPINAHYMPDCFPGLMFRIAQSRMVLIVFKSGCCILTGVKSRREALVAWTWFYCHILWHFQVQGDAPQLTDIEYGRRARQDNSTVALVCESVRDVTHSLLATAIAQQRADLDAPATDYYASLREMTQRLGPVPQQSKPKTDLEDWLAAQEPVL